MKNYVIKNCPAYRNKHCDAYGYDCKNYTNCILKQIFDFCVKERDSIKSCSKSDIEVVQEYTRARFAKEILKTFEEYNAPRKSSKVSNKNLEKFAQKIREEVNSENEKNLNIALNNIKKDATRYEKALRKIRAANKCGKFCGGAACGSCNNADGLPAITYKLAHKALKNIDDKEYEEW